MKTSRILLVSTLLLVSFRGLPAQAAVFCVTSSVELQTALDHAGSNGQDDEIRITEGTYPVPPNDSFRFLESNDADLTLSGGWIAFAGNPCGRRRSNASALDTILDGELRQRVMRIFPGEQSDVSISGLSFFSGSPVEGNGGLGGGLEVLTFGDTAGTITVERSAFIGNRSAFSPAVSISGSTTTRFMNNLVVGNISDESSGAVGLIQNDQLGVYAINNTIVNNMTESVAGIQATGLRVSVSGSSQALIANNILWGNDLADMAYAGDGVITSRNNTIETPIGTATVTLDNVSIAPVFEDIGFLNFNLVPGSALANIGLSPPLFPVPPIFDLNWSLPDRDVEGKSRITNGRVDIGAFETPQDGIFSDRFE